MLGKYKSEDKSSGFTMMELMISIGIIAIMSGIALPNFLSYIPKARVNGAARTIMNDLMAARMKAVKLNQRTQVFFVDDHQYKICNDADGDATVYNCEGDAVVKDIQAEYSDVTISSTNNPRFMPRGTATNLATITVANGSGSKDISISIAGRVKIN